MELPAARRIWDRFEGILGRVYRVLGKQIFEKIEIFGIFGDNTNFNGGMAKNTFFSMGGPSIR